MIIHASLTLKIPVLWATHAVQTLVTEDLDLRVYVRPMIGGLLLVRVRKRADNVKGTVGGQTFHQDNKTCFWLVLRFGASRGREPLHEELNLCIRSSIRDSAYYLLG
jgi:hypothetical protein